ncbi:MAG: dienelactone hydrolase family protein [Woeseiaceae bacterium]|nr:dienelactone hydrolase family protein [Woeseiaceae bacterium]
MTKYVRASAALALIWALSACSGDNTDSAEQAAARDNLDAMSEVHATDTTEATPAVEEAPAREVVAEVLPYAEVGNDLIYGHFAFPEDMIEPLPAIIVIHEWWGLNDNVRAMADRLAGEGYIVLAVDLFGGEVATTPVEAREKMQKVIENPRQAVDNLRQALTFVDDVAEAPKVATLGWCFGGGWSLNAALEFSGQLDATVIYYGQVTSDTERLSALESPVLGIFAAEDRGISVDSVRGFEAAMDQLGKDGSIYVYPGVGHAFANPTGRNYNAEAADDAWGKTLEFLRQELVVSSGEADASDDPSGSSVESSSGG